MPSPSKTLAELVPSEIILQELGAGVKSLPAVGQCPVDASHKIALHPDDDTLWGVCEQCDFRGDSLDILKVKYGIPSIEAVLSKLESDGKIKFAPKNLLTDYQIEKVRRDNFDSFVREAKASLLKHICDPKILDEFGARPPYRQDWVNGFGRFVGTARQEMLEQVFGSKSIHSAGPPLVLPYYDMPGRLATIRFVSYNSKGIRFLDKATNRSGGLFMMESIRPDSEYVIAVDDPVLACRAQLKQLKNESTLLPIVAWHPDTRYWPIVSKRLVLLSAELTVDVFRQAKLVPGAHVCCPSMSSIDLMALLEDYEAKNWAHYVLKNARPWVVTLKDHLLSMDEYTAARFARELKISSNETGELLFECTADEKSRLSNILDLRMSVKNCMLEDKKIIEREGCWWTYTPKGMPVRISTGSFVLEKSVCYKNKGNYFIGTLTVDKRHERFLAPAEPFMTSPTKWLRKFALNCGMGVVRTLPGWDRRLVDVSFSFNSDKLPVLHCDAAVGWSDDRTKFSFPNVALVNGRVDETDVGLPTEDMPCCSVTGHTSQKSLWRDLLEDSPVNRVFWAILGAMGTNIGSKLFGINPSKIAVVGPQRNLAMVASLLDLKTIQVKSSAQLVHELSRNTMHDVPFVLFPGAIRFQTLIDTLETSGARNVAVHMTLDQALQVTGKDWVFVNAADMSGSTAHLNGIPSILADMVRAAQLYRTDFDPVDPVHSFMGLVSKWYRLGKAPEMPDTVLTEAEKLITPESVYGKLSITEAFLYSLFSLMFEDKVTTSRVGFNSRPGEVEIAPEFIKVSKMVMQKMLLPVATTKITSELLADGLLDQRTDAMSDWFIKRTEWDSQYAKWATLRDPR